MKIKFIGNLNFAVWVPVETMTLITTSFWDNPLIIMLIGVGYGLVCGVQVLTQWVGCFCTSTSDTVWFALCGYLHFHECKNSHKCSMRHCSSPSCLTMVDKWSLPLGRHKIEPNSSPAPVCGKAAKPVLVPTRLFLWGFHIPYTKLWGVN